MKAPKSTKTPTKRLCIGSGTHNPALVGAGYPALPKSAPTFVEGQAIIFAEYDSILKGLIAAPVNLRAPRTPLSIPTDLDSPLGPESDIPAGALFDLSIPPDGPPAPPAPPAGSEVPIGIDQSPPTDPSPSAP